MFPEIAIAVAVTVIGASPFVMIRAARRPANGEREQLRHLQKVTRELKAKVAQTCRDCHIKI